MQAKRNPRRELRLVASSDTPLAQRNVTMHNKIVSAAHVLNLSEKRLMSAAIAKLDSRATRAPTEPIRINAHEFAECFGLDESTAYVQLREAAERLFDRHIERVVDVPFGKTKTRIERIRWLDRSVYAEGEGFVEINFTNAIAPFLLALEKRFTTYKLEQTRALRSVHTWRLFENLKQWEATGKWIVEIDDFHFIMESKDAYRKNFSHLRQWVIEPALKELRDVCGMDVEWAPHKRGRKVVRLLFTFKPVEAMEVLPVSPEGEGIAFDAPAGEM